MSAFRRTISALLLVLVLGAGLFLMTWDEPPPIQEIRMTVPDEQLPR